MRFVFITSTVIGVKKIKNIKYGTFESFGENAQGIILVLIWKPLRIFSRLSFIVTIPLIRILKL